MLRSRATSRTFATTTHYQPPFSELNPRCRHPLNLRHVVVLNGSCKAVIPLNGDLAPRCFNNRAEIVRRGAPANPVADLEFSGLFASHWPSAPPTQFGWIYRSATVIASANCCIKNGFCNTVRSRYCSGSPAAPYPLAKTKGMWR